MSGGSRRVVRWYLGNSSQQGEHLQSETCPGMGCGYIVEEHQSFRAPEEGDVPEFTIEVAYKTHDHVGNPVTPGYRYVIKWLENGLPKQLRNYGFSSKEYALSEAREQATNIARELAPVHVETYTPEV